MFFGVVCCVFFGGICGIKVVLEWYVFSIFCVERYVSVFSVLNGVFFVRFCTTFFKSLQHGCRPSQKPITWASPVTNLPQHVFYPSPTFHDIGHTRDQLVKTLTSTHATTFHIPTCQNKGNTCTNP